MFDIGWAELLVIGIVLILVVGPKELPGMLRTFGRTSARLRSMAGDFRRQFDEAMREAELDEVRQLAQDARKLDPTAEIRKNLDPLRKVGQEIRSGLAEATSPPKSAPAAAPQAPATSGGEVTAPDGAEAAQKAPEAKVQPGEAAAAPADKKSGE
jgi:sec-independent protein translocase protein TatB